MVENALNIGLDAGYFGFSGIRAAVAGLYARPYGATQSEVNTFEK